MCRRRVTKALKLLGVESYTLVYSITSSARTISDWGTVIPSIRVVLALTTSSSSLDSMTGRVRGLGAHEPAQMLRLLRPARRGFY